MPIQVRSNLENAPMRVCVRWASAGVAAALFVTACGSASPLASPSPTTTPTPVVSAPSTGATPGILTVSPGTARSTPPIDAPTFALALGLNEAGFDLWLRQPVGENLVFSPMSIGHTALMLRAAADGPTGAAIDEAFGLPESNDAHTAWNAIDTAMADATSEDERVTLTTAGRIWPAIGIQPDQAWIDLLATQHGATIEVLDIGGDPEGSRQTINNWTRDETQGLIPELLPRATISSDTALVLTDTVYFDAEWLKRLNSATAVVAPFTRLDGSQVDVEYLTDLIQASSGAGPGYVAGRLHYIAGGFSLLLIVPDQGGFEEFRSRLDQDSLSQIDASLTSAAFELWMPRWQTSNHLNLNSWLSELGILPGSYPGIDPAAVLDGAMHAADISVDEDGTVAGAATAAWQYLSGPPEPELVVRADRPFLYVVRHDDTGLILFAGQVTDPTS